MMATSNRQVLTAIAALPEDERWAAVCELAAASARNYPAVVVARRTWDALCERCETHGVGNPELDWQPSGAFGMTHARATERARALLGEYDRRKRANWARKQAAKEPPPDLNLKQGDAPEGDEPPPI